MSLIKQRINFVRGLPRETEVKEDGRRCRRSSFRRILRLDSCSKGRILLKKSVVGVGKVTETLLIFEGSCRVHRGRKGVVVEDVVGSG